MSCTHAIVTDLDGKVMKVVETKYLKDFITYGNRGLLDNINYFHEVDNKYYRIIKLYEAQTHAMKTLRDTMEYVKNTPDYDESYGFCHKPIFPVLKQKSEIEILNEVKKIQSNITKVVDKVNLQKNAVELEIETLRNDLDLLGKSVSKKVAEAKEYYLHCKNIGKPPEKKPKPFRI